MGKRTHQQIAQAINDLSRRQFHVVESGFAEPNLYKFRLSTEEILYFTPYDTDKTISWGLWNHGLLRT